VANVEDLRALVDGTLAIDTSNSDAWVIERKSVLPSAALPQRSAIARKPIEKGSNCPPRMSATAPCVTASALSNATARNEPSALSASASEDRQVAA
jgi:hypothetical protein